MNGEPRKTFTHILSSNLFVIVTDILLFTSNALPTCHSNQGYYCVTTFGNICNNIQIQSYFTP